jgi:hypothetical protein
MMKLSRQAFRDARWIMTFAAGTPWSSTSGFKPNREADLIHMGVLVPTGTGFMVAHVDLTQFEER